MKVTNYRPNVTNDDQLSRGGLIKALLSFVCRTMMAPMPSLSHMVMSWR